LDAAVDADPRRFVFTSTIGTIGIPAERRPATEEDEFNWAAHRGARLDPPGCAVLPGQSTGPQKQPAKNR
jgi:nucleoside-diphosphate-sugar epimerase